jgi:FHA domain
MSFKLFVYYCALCGAWAAFLAWALSQVSGINSLSADDVIHQLLKATLIGGVLGMLVASALGLVDAMLNAVGTQRFLRVGLCLGLGLMAGAVGGFVGQLFGSLSDYLVFVGWIIAGVLIGGIVAAYDILYATIKQEDLRAPLKKLLNGLIGGFVGGFLGGLPYTFLRGSLWFPNSGKAFSLVLLGACIGLLVGLAQVFLKEAWITVEAGFRPGRELLLTKDETLIGRAEGCDLGLFGDSSIDKKHARIILKNRRYYIEDNDSEDGTYLNDHRVKKATLLSDGDEIRVGSSVLRFGERQARDQ